MNSIFHYVNQGIRVAATCCAITLAPLLLAAQQDTQYVKNLYDRVLEFDESKLDSFSYYISQIDQVSQRLKFDKGDVLSERLRGIQAEYSGDYQGAISHYLNSLDISRKNGWENYEDCALGDLGIVYTNIKNPAKAKEYYKQALDLSVKRGEVYSIVNSLTNLGAICNMMHEPDSALLYLDSASAYTRRFPEVTDLVSLRNNLGNAWFAKKDYARALAFFRENYQQNLRSGDSAQLWYDVLNMGDVMIEMKRYDSARIWIDRAMRLAVHQGSRRKVADVELLNSKFHERTGDYRKAFASLKEWSVIDTSLVNAETRQTLLEMEERFKTNQREQENKLLQTQVEAAKFRSRNLLIGLLSAAALALVSGIFLYLNQKKNRKLEEKGRLIQAQNEKLADLNAEKNSLISMVSHDLHTPFTTIQMWAQVLESGKDHWPEDEKKAITRIQQAAENGARMINRVLDVEGSDVDRRRIQLESIDVADLLRDLSKTYDMDARAKSITIITPGPDQQVKFLSDHQLLERAIANLLTNAVKYSPHGGRIWLSVEAQNGQVLIRVRDEGPGISAEDQRKIFGKYTQATSRPTGGEKSTGLGLYIVRRIMDELQGEVTCTSTPGQGAEFTLRLRS
jgi:signal transduction histidine kinase